jgi:hypothetical protein
MKDIVKALEPIVAIAAKLLKKIIGRKLASFITCC